jgi:hypothetical protein
VKKFYRIPHVTVFLVLLFSSCSWLDRDIQIPSYIYIPSYTFEAMPTDGSSSSNISDAWVFVNGQKIGAFELPATIPVLASGKCDLEIFPGIKLNGTSATRAAYTFYTKYSAQHELFPDSVITIQPHATYAEGLQFAFIEDFESVGIIFEKTLRSDTLMVKSNDPQHVFEGLYSGYIAVDAARPFCEVESLNSYQLSQTGGFSFVEIDCKSTMHFYIGVMANEAGYTTQHPIIVITPSDTWKKIYVNLTPTVSRLQKAYSFNIFIAAQLDQSETKGEVWIDNVKLIHH